jgi:hypothetical protein
MVSPLDANFSHRYLELDRKRSSAELLTPAERVEYDSIAHRLAFQTADRMIEGISAEVEQTVQKTRSPITSSRLTTTLKGSNVTFTFSR